MSTSMKEALNSDIHDDHVTKRHEFEDSDSAWYRIDYTCPDCLHKWIEEYSSASDSECHECGLENITPFYWEEI